MSDPLRVAAAVEGPTDVIVLRADADVAGGTSASAGIRYPPSQELPCERDCPPADQTTNAL